MSDGDGALAALVLQALVDRGYLRVLDGGQRFELTGDPLPPPDPYQHLIYKSVLQDQKQSVGKEDKRSNTDNGINCIAPAAAGKAECIQKGTSGQPLVDEGDMKLAEQLVARIREHAPGFRQPNMQAWAREMGRIRRIDKREPAEIERLINVAQADSFWMTNILSPDKLRKHWTRLEILSKRAATPGRQTTESWLEDQLKIRANAHRLREDDEGDDEPIIPVRWKRTVGPASEGATSGGHGAVVPDRPGA